MKIGKNFGLTMILTAILFMCSCAQETVNMYDQSSAVKVAVITGGHDFDGEEFFGMFDSFVDIEYEHLPQKDHSETFEDISDWPYDVVVLYNMSQEISPKRRKNFVSLLNKGVGLVALHHSIGAFQEWPEYKKIIGGKFYLDDSVENGVSYKKSDYKHGVDIPVRIANKHHQITKDLRGFTIHDESYKNCIIEPDNNVLLTTDEPSSDKSICWTRTYGNSKVVYIQPGHGSEAYNNESYRTLVANAIKWSADRLD
jgi:type 1 glutamine amidotransferase